MAGDTKEKASGWEPRDLFKDKSKNHGGNLSRLENLSWYLTLKKKKFCGGSPVSDLRELGKNISMVLKSHLFYLACYF